MHTSRSVEEKAHLSVTSSIWIEKTIRANLQLHGVEQVAFYIFDKDDNILHEIIDTVGERDITPWINAQGAKLLDCFKHQPSQEILESPSRCKILSYDLSLYTGVADLVYDARAGFCMYSNRSFSKSTLDELHQSWLLIQSWANSWVSYNKMLEYWEQLYTKNHKASELTRSEHDVLDMLISGLNGPEIAEKRLVSKETIKSQIKSILHKTQCRHQNELVSRFCYGHWFTQPKLDD